MPECRIGRVRLNARDITSSERWSLVLRGSVAEMPNAIEGVLVIITADIKRRIAKEPVVFKYR